MWPLFFVFFSVLSLSTAGKFGDSLRQCDVDNQQQLNNCLFHIVDDLRPFMPTGIPEINVPVLDPMQINAIRLNQGGGPVSIQSTFSQIQVRGLSNFTTVSVSADPDAMTLNMVLKIPVLRITGQYQTKGQVLVLPVEGSGTFWNVLNDVTVDGRSNLVLRGSKPNEVLQVTDQKLDLKVGKIRMRLNNLFNGDAVLGETVNTFLNENSQEVFAEVKPEMTKQVSEVVVRVMNDALTALPAQKFLKSQKRRS